MSFKVSLFTSLKCRRYTIDKRVLRKPVGGFKAGKPWNRSAEPLNYVAKTASAILLASQLPDIKQ